LAATRPADVHGRGAKTLVGRLASCGVRVGTAKGLAGDWDLLAQTGFHLLAGGLETSQILAVEGGKRLPGCEDDGCQSAANSRCLSSKFAVERCIPVLSSRRSSVVHVDTAQEA